MRFPAERRLRAASEFSRVRAHGTSYPAKFVVVNVLEMEPEVPWRVGLITSKKVGGAVQRNLVRRRLREIVRAADIRDGLWIVTVARWRAAEATFAELREDWLRVAKRARILVRKSETTER
ncbi:MAG: ribonuclease P protein component [Roseimicrobium sp.]